MKKSLNSGQSVWIGLRLAVACGLVVSAGGLRGLAQPTSSEKAVSSSTSTGVSVSTANGQAVVTVDGKQVYSQPAKGTVSSRSSNANGVQYSAVYDGDQVVWENVPGAAQHLASAPGGATGSSGTMDPQQFAEQYRKTMERLQAEQRRIQEAYGMSNVMQRGGTNSFDQGRGSSWSSGSGSGSSWGTGQSQGGGHGSSQSSSGAVGTKTVNGSTVVIYEGREVSVGATKGPVSTKSRVVDGKAYAVAYDGDRVIWENVPGAAESLK